MLAADNTAYVIAFCLARDAFSVKYLAILMFIHLVCQVQIRTLGLKSHYVFKLVMLPGCLIWSRCGRIQTYDPGAKDQTLTSEPSLHTYM